MIIPTVAIILVIKLSVCQMWKGRIDRTLFGYYLVVYCCRSNYQETSKLYSEPLSGINGINYHDRVGEQEVRKYLEVQFPDAVRLNLKYYWVKMPSYWEGEATGHVFLEIIFDY